MVARASIQHPNVVPATVDPKRGRPMRVVIGPCSVPALSERSRPLDGVECCRMLAGAGEAVAALASSGLTARDLTPDHVHFDGGHVTLLSDTGMPLDLFPRPPIDSDRYLAYRSPEELHGAQPNSRSAVYSLGAVLFTALTGKPPFGGAWSQVYLSHTDAPRPRPSDSRSGVSKEVDAVVVRAMAVKPADRYASPGELAVALADAVTPKQDRQPPKRETKPPKRRAKDGGPRRAPKAKSAAGNGKPASASKNGKPLKPDPVSVATVPRPEARARTKAHALVPRRAAAVSLVEHQRRALTEHQRRAVTAVGNLQARVRSGVAVPHALRTRLSSLHDARRAPLTQRRRTGRGDWPRGLLLLPVLLVAAALVAGVVLSDDNEPSPQRVTAAGVSVELPSGWNTTQHSGDFFPPPALTANTDRHGGATLVVGLLGQTADPDRVVRAGLPAGADASSVKLGRSAMLRYSTPQSSAGRVARGYVLYTTGSFVVIFCKARTSAGLRSCADAASSVRIRGEQVVSPQLAAHREQQAALRQLLETRLRGRQRLLAADVADDQIDAAKSLQAAYETAAQRVRRSSVPDPNASTLAAALDASATGYAELAEAVSVGDQQAYDDARAFILQAEASLWKEDVKRG